MKIESILNFIQENSKILIAIGLLLLAVCSIFLIVKIEDVLVEKVVVYSYYFLIFGLAVQLLDFIVHPQKWQERGVKIAKPRTFTVAVLPKWKVGLFSFCLIAFMLIIVIGVFKTSKIHYGELTTAQAVSRELVVTIKDCTLFPVFVEEIVQNLYRGNFFNITTPSMQNYYLYSQSYIFYPTDYKKEADKIYEILKETPGLEKIILEEDDRLINEIEIILGKNLISRTF